jgi:hypothetical protein
VSTKNAKTTEPKPYSHTKSKVPIDIHCYPRRFFWYCSKIPKGPSGIVNDCSLQWDGVRNGAERADMSPDSL